MHSPNAEQSSERGVGEIRFVLRVRLPIVQLNINVAGRNRSFFVRDPDLAEIFWLTQGAEAIDTVAGRIEKIDPGPRGVGVIAARRQTWRSRKHVRRILGFVQDIVAQAGVILSARGKSVHTPKIE